MIINLNNQARTTQLEKYVDIDMNSIYKTFSHKADVNYGIFAIENSTEISGQIWKEDSKLTALAVDKQFKHQINANYSGYKIAKNINVNAVKQSIHNIFSWLLGERILNPEFGTNLRQYLYEGITSETEELINAEIRQCILRWEPRANIVSITNISTVNDTENNTMHLQIIYTIPSLSNEQYSYSYYYNKII